MAALLVGHARDLPQRVLELGVQGLELLARRGLARPSM